MNRSKNFVDSERKILIELVDKYKHTVECKKTDSKSSQEKMDAWNQLTMEFNSISTYTNRETKTLQRFGKNLKIRAKADTALARRERLKTGGGPPVKLSDETELVQSK